MKRRWLACLLSGLMLLSLVGCGGEKAPAAQDTPEVQKSAPATPPDLSGEWKQANSNSEDSYQAAYIADGAVEVYWVLNEGSDDESIALYWAGTFTPPETADEPYAWESANDKSRTNSALMASGDDTKTFTYRDGKISYSVSIQGQTVDVELTKQEWGYGAKGNDNFLTDAILNGGTASGEGETMSGSGDLGAYHVEIKDATLVRDYEENLAMVITYAWTNNSEETTSAMMTILEKAFQDGVELDNAMIFDSSLYNAEMSSKDVRPGTTIDVQCAFTLTSETSPVELELSEAFSWTNNDKVTMNFDPSELGFG